MMRRSYRKVICAIATLSLLPLTACIKESIVVPDTPGLEIKFLTGSALGEFCYQAALQFNQQSPQLDDGTPYRLTCEAQGSGDIVTRITNLAQNFQSGTLPPDAADFPTLVALDGEIYHAQLSYQINRLFPGQNYIPEITDAPLLANSPMVFMVPEDLAAGVEKQADLFKTLVTVENHQQLDPKSANILVYYAQTAPTKSNSGLQALVTQFASVSGKRPEQLTVSDVQQYQSQVQQIQRKVTRYGVSTDSLAKSMVAFGEYWASIASVYESSVIAANSENTQGKRYRAVYPKVTFTSNMRAILPNAPWVSEAEKAAATKIIEYLRSPQAQQIATNLGLRPGVPGVALGDKFSPRFGVNPNATYDSLRPPQPEVVEAMLNSWQEFAKKPSQVVVVVDSSGSMQGDKLPAVQNTLRSYVEQLGKQEKIVLIDFDTELRSPVIVDGTPQGRDRGMQFISSLQAQGGTRLYDAALFAQKWLLENYRADAINAVVILTDGEDATSQITLEQLEQTLKNSHFTTDKRIAFFTVGYGNEGEFNPDILQQIATLNGGYYRKGDPATISQLMSDLQVEF